MICFNAASRTFKIVSKDSTYAFRITENNYLEHLFWGPTLHNNDDLSYIQISNVAQPFDPTGEIENVLSGENKTVEDFGENQDMSMLTKMDRDEVMDAWKSFRGSLGPMSSRKSGGGSKSLGSIQKRRLENLSWRLLHLNKTGKSNGKSAHEVMERSNEDFDASNRQRNDALSTTNDASSAPNSPEFEKKKSPDGRAHPKLGVLVENENENESLDHEEQSNSMRPSSGSLRILKDHHNHLNSSDDEYEQREADARSLFRAAKQKSVRFAMKNHPPNSPKMPVIAKASSSLSLNAMGEPRTPHPGSPKQLSILSELQNKNEEEGMSDSLDVLKELPLEESVKMQAARLARARKSSNSMSDSNSRLGKNLMCREYGDYGTGDFRQPSICARIDADGSTIASLQYVSHRITKGKDDFGLPDVMPRVRVGKEVGDSDEIGTDTSMTLVVELQDRHNGLKVELVYVALANYDMIVRRAVVTNATHEINSNPSHPHRSVIHIERVMSSTVDFEVDVGDYYMMHFSGSWARERHPIHKRLQQGITAFGSTRGTSSHQHNPFAAITTGDSKLCETHGRVFGFAFIYSGNFLIEADVSDTGRTRLNVGLNPESFRWSLGPGESFATPECACVFSPAGLERMSHTFHQVIRERIVHPRWQNIPCPILVNSWEAEYFDVTHESIVAMSQAAKEVGVELMVLDDGWFGQRNNIRSSLGDWWPSKEKFPLGLRAVAKDVNAEGLEFGLWIEPEMVSEDSRLFDEHPDWCLHVPGRERSKGRHQLVLDLSRDEVREHIFNMLSKILSTVNITYIKWDMNRHLTEVYSYPLKPEQQGEVSHRFMLGVYRLHKNLTESFPHIRFEGCSGGGGRFDMGMLYYVPQIWCSDDTDALMRMRIQHGTSYVYPSSVVGAHFSVVPNHITQGISRRRTRALVAMCGVFGYELDLRHVPQCDVDLFKYHVELYKSIRHIINKGTMYRLWDPFTSKYCSWSYVLEDKTEALVFAFNRTSTFWSNLVPRLRLRGLHPDKIYAITEPLPNNRTKLESNLQVVKTDSPVYQFGQEYSYLNGSTLMNCGLIVRFFTQDDSVMFHLKVVESAPTNHFH